MLFRLKLNRVIPKANKKVKKGKGMLTRDSTAIFLSAILNKSLYFLGISVEALLLNAFEGTTTKE